jgi:heme-degrading monooxygenase HmoA
MIAKIIIRRRFKEGNTRKIVGLLNELRSKLLNQSGYMSGETLVQSGHSNKLVIISTWQTLEDWHRWKDSEERGKIEAMLELYQERKTEYEEFLVGTPLQKELTFPI